MNQRKRAFTLIELLVVITIIGILAGISTIAFLNQQKTARDAQRKSDLNIISGALQNYFAVNRLYPVRSSDGEIQSLDPTNNPARRLSCYYFSDGASILFESSDKSRTTHLPDRCYQHPGQAHIVNWMPGLREGGYLNTIPTDPQQNLLFSQPNFEGYTGPLGVRADYAKVFSGINGHRFYAYSTIMNYPNTKQNSQRFFWLAAYLENENDSETVHNKKTILFGTSGGSPTGTMEQTWPQNSFVITSQN